MSHDSAANDAKATVALPSAVSHPEGETLPLPAGTMAGTPSGDAWSTVPLPGATVPLDGSPRVPEKIGRFQVRGWVGSGAFGDVYRAHDPQLDREVALKVAKPGTLETPERVARFLREAKSAANLRHPNIVPLYETGRDGDRLFIATAFISGRTLEAVIQEANEAGRPIPLKTATRIVRKLAEALAYAHGQGIVHRDVKPANVMLDETEEPLLLDFGLAARAEEGAERLTQDGQGMGTPAYMAPEQADGHGVAASDQYSLGCAFYELLTGQTPFAGGPAQQLFLHKTQPVPSPRKMRREVPRDLDTVVLKCVEKEASRRYGSCAGLAEDLRRLLDNEPVTARPIGPVERLGRWAKRKPTAAAAYVFSTLAVLLMLAMYLVFGFWREAEDSRQWAEGAKTEAETARDVADRLKLTADAARKVEEAERQKADTNAEKSARFEYGQAIRAAHQDWRDNNIRGALDLLNRRHPDRRGWEWNYVHRLCNNQLYTLDGHRGTVNSVSWSPDGTRMINTSGTATIWDARTGAKLAQPLFSCESASWSPDGSLLLTTHSKSPDRASAVVWEVKRGTEFANPKSLNTKNVTSALWSPDGGQIVTISDDGTVILRDSHTNAEVATLKGKAYFASYNMDGSRILTAGADATARVWDAKDGTELISLTGHTSKIDSASWSPDGARILTTSYDMTVRVWDAKTGAQLPILKGIAAEVKSVSWSPDGARILTTNRDMTARLWDTKSGAEIASMKGATLATWSPDGSRIVTGSDDRTVRVWDAKSGAELTTLKGDTGHLWGRASWSPDGSRIVTGSDDGTVRVWDAKSGAELSTLKGHTSNLQWVTWSPDGSRIVSAGSDGTVRVWDPWTKPENTTLKGHSSKLSLASWSPDGSQVLTASDDGTARIWASKTGKEMAILKDDRNMEMASWSPDGTQVVTNGSSNTAVVWDAKTGVRRQSLKGHTSWLKSASWSPDGSRIVTASHDTTSRVWDAKSGAEIATLKGHTDEVYKSSWNLDGSLILSVASDGTMRIWDTKTWGEISTLKDDQDLMTSASFSPDGLRVVTACRFGAPVRLWDAKRAVVLTTFEGSISGNVDSKCWSSDGQWLVLASRDGLAIRGLSVWNTKTGAEVAFLNVTVSDVISVSWSSDGSRIVTGGRDNTARVFDSKSGAELLTLKGHTGAVNSALWSPEGARILTASEDHTAKIWDATALDRQFSPRERALREENR